jgi:ubiquitin C-terminal hydrolase
MCNEHILYFIWGLLEDVKPNQAIDAIIKSVKDEQEEERAERVALHV